MTVKKHKNFSPAVLKSPKCFLLPVLGSQYQEKNSGLKNMKFVRVMYMTFLTFGALLSASLGRPEKVGRHPCKNCIDCFWKCTSCYLVCNDFPSLLATLAFR